MSLYRQVKTHAALLGLAMALSALAACSSGSDPTPVPPTTPAPTVPLIVTRIVTPRPTYTPLPTPTLNYDMNPVAGEWILRYDVTITESALADRLRYTAAADLSVNLDGSISGGGYFTPNITDSPCNAQVTENAPLAFTIEGTTRPEGSAVWADVRLLPDDPHQAEAYTVLCPDYNDVRAHSGPVLWPALIALNRLEWSFALESGQAFTFSADLSQDATNATGGLLDAEVRLSRN